MITRADWCRFAAECPPESHGRTPDQEIEHLRRVVLRLRVMNIRLNRENRSLAVRVRQLEEVCAAF